VPRRLVHLLIVLIVALVLADPVRAGAPPPGRLTIGVGGWNSVEDPSPGAWEIARLIDREALLFALPGGIPRRHIGRYEGIEQQIGTRVRAWARGGQSVVLVGHSYGATLLLRVLHELAGDGVALQRVRLILLDRDTLDYPLATRHTNRAPEGLRLALNVYETLDDSLRGGRLPGATNVDASAVISDERRLLGELVPGDPRAGASVHVYVTYSFAVRRRILEAFGRSYLPGVWETVGAPASSPFYWLVDVRDRDGHRFSMRHWAGSRRGMLEYRGTVTHGVLAGRFSQDHVPAPPGCAPGAAAPGAAGTFSGSRTAETMHVIANGTESGYIVDPEHPGSCPTSTHPYTSSFDVTVAARFTLPRRSAPTPP
jgi:hypothetical protein